jgi:hypothetical protein
MYIKVTRYAKLKERRMVIHNASEGVEPRNLCIASGQGLLHSEAGIAAHDNGECDSGVSLIRLNFWDLLISGFALVKGICVKPRNGG